MNNRLGIKCHYCEEVVRFTEHERKRNETWPHYRMGTHLSNKHPEIWKRAQRERNLAKARMKEAKKIAGDADSETEV